MAQELRAKGIRVDDDLARAQQQERQSLSDDFSGLKRKGTNHSSEAQSGSITLPTRCILVRRGRQTGHHQLSDDTLTDI